MVKLLGTSCYACLLNIFRTFTHIYMNKSWRSGLTCCLLQDCLCLSRCLCLEGSRDLSRDRYRPAPQSCTSPPRICPRRFPSRRDGGTGGWIRSRWPGGRRAPPSADKPRSCPAPTGRCEDGKNI